MSSRFTSCPGYKRSPERHNVVKVAMAARPRRRTRSARRCTGSFRWPRTGLRSGRRPAALFPLRADLRGAVHDEFVVANSLVKIARILSATLSPPALLDLDEELDYALVTAELAVLKPVGLQDPAGLVELEGLSI